MQAAVMSGSAVMVEADAVVPAALGAARRRAAGPSAHTRSIRADLEISKPSFLVDGSATKGTAVL
jgi:hypothetical protein